VLGAQALLQSVSVLLPLEPRIVHLEGFDDLVVLVALVLEGQSQLCIETIELQASARFGVT
jgi:hypothetical protein